MIELKQFARIYCDSNFLICLIEKSPTFFVSVIDVLVSVRKNQCVILTSELAAAECLYKPYKNDDLELIEKYEALFTNPEILSPIPLTSYVLMDASRLAGKLGLKLLDAIHYASALEAECDYLVTGDRKFSSSQDLEVIHLRPSQ